jgi:putative transposase
MPMTLGKSVGNSILITVMLGNDEAVAQLTFELFDMRYRRSKTPGATYFFTVVTFRRRKILCEPENRELLRTAFRMMKSLHPFAIDAFVLLPEHLHCIWTLPPGDTDYSMRWNVIKGHLSRYCLDKYKSPPSAAQQRKRAQTVWQPRFWEHQIRDEWDYEKHCDYIHWNPVKHGLVSRVCDWPYSSFHRFVQLGIYPIDWTRTPEDCGDFSDSGYGE